MYARKKINIMKQKKRWNEFCFQTCWNNWYWRYPPDTANQDRRNKVSSTPPPPPKLSTRDAFWIMVQERRIEAHDDSIAKLRREIRVWADSSEWNLGANSEEGAMQRGF